MIDELGGLVLIDSLEGPPRQHHKIIKVGKEESRLGADDEETLGKEDNTARDLVTWTAAAHETVRVTQATPRSSFDARPHHHHHHRKSVRVVNKLSEKQQQKLRFDDVTKRRGRHRKMTRHTVSFLFNELCRICCFLKSRLYF